MDGKTMRAALAAAVRVTISTSLLGCGGQATSDAGGPTTPNPESGGERTPSPVNERPRYVASSGGSSAGSAGSSSTATAGAPVVASGGTSAGSTGEMHEAGAPSTPEPTGCEAANACIKSLSGLDFDDPLPDAAAKQCCATILKQLTGPQQTPEVESCGWQLSSDFFALPAHTACCNAVPGAWGQPACSPWGPPMPPTLPRAALLGWGAAA